MDTKSATREPASPTTVANYSRFLRNWLWLWPGMGLLSVIWGTLDPSAFERCPQVYWTSPLIGMIAASWTWLRTRDRRYLPQALASGVLFVVGAWMFWTVR